MTDMLTPKMTSVKPLDNYKLEICFETGEKKIFDVTPYIGGNWYSALADKQYFKTVRLLPDGYDITWPDGQDLAPHELYRNSVPLTIPAL
jgi:hypothetical protein